MSVELEAVVNVAKVAHEEKQGTDRSTCSSLSRIAVDDQTVFRIGYIIEEQSTQKKLAKIIYILIVAEM